MAGLLGRRPGRSSSRARPPGAARRCTRASAWSRSARRSTAFLTGPRVRASSTPGSRASPTRTRPRARAIATVELTEAADRPIGTYSKGMRQRAKLAGALVHDPPILLLDEPFNGMDPRQRLHMMGLLRVDGRRGPDDPLLVAHPRGGRAARRLGPRRLRRPAGRGRRLPLDPPADDRPAAHVHGPLVGRPPARGGAAGRPDGLRRRAGRRPALGPDVRLRGVHARAAARRPRRRASRCSRSARPTTRSRASSATWCADERVHDARRRHRSAGCSAAAGCS